MKRINWISYIILIFIAYSVIKNNNENITNSVTKLKEITSTPEGLEEPKGSYIDQKIGNLLTNIVRTQEGKEFLSKFITTIPQSDPNIQMILEKEKIGTGREVICGDIAEISLTNSSGTYLYNLQIGKRKLGKIIDEAIIGMKVNGSKKINIKSITTKEDDIQEIKLEKILTKSNFIEEDFRIFRKGIKIGTPASCGDEIILNYKISKIDGKLIYNSLSNGPINIKLGESALPIFLNKSLLSIYQSELLTTIVKPKLLKNFDNDYFDLFVPNTVPKQETLIYDIDIVAINKK